MSRQRRLTELSPAIQEQITAHLRERGVSDAIFMSQAIEHITDPAITDSPLAELQFKFKNRQTMARQLLPNSPIKRFFYLRKLKTVEQQFLARISACNPTDSPPVPL